MNWFESFLSALESDPTTLDRLQRDPAGVLRGHGASDEEIATLGSGDFSAMHTLTPSQRNRLADAARRAPEAQQAMMLWPWPWPWRPDDE